MSQLIEQVVKKNKTAKEVIITVVIVLAAVLIPFTIALVGILIAQYYLLYCAFFALCFTIYGAWYFISSLNYEFEYAVLDGTLRVDKVIAKRKRKKVIKLEVREISEFNKVKDLNEVDGKYSKVYNALGDEKCDRIFTAQFHNVKGDCLLIFSPNDKMLNAMRPYFAREIATKIYLNKY